MKSDSTQHSMTVETAQLKSEPPHKTGSTFTAGGGLPVLLATGDGDPPEAREHWGNKLDFILSCLGYAVGLGNVWRFPYLVGRTGGAAFLIPYFVMMVFAGLPVFYMELAMGQYAGLSPILLYRNMCPLFTGLAHAMIAISGYTSVYYNVIIAWSLHYLFASMQGTMPWVGCNHPWNTKRCFDDTVAKGCDRASGQWYFYGRCYDQNETVADYQGRSIGRALVDDLMRLNVSHGAEHVSEPDAIAALKRAAKANGTWRQVNTKTLRRSSAKEYNNYVLGIVESESADSLTWTEAGLAHVGLPKWDLCACLLLAWLFVFVFLVGGIKSAGKVVYFTATFPYLILLILFFRGITLEGAGDGLDFYLNPDWKLVVQSTTWSTAANQIFFSLSLGWGGLTTLASYNQFNNNLMRDTILVVLGNCATSLFAGFVIFPIIGHLAFNTGQSVSDIAASGPSLAFVAYPSALATLQPAWLWSIAFFFMLFLLGIDSQLVLVEVVITAVLDWFPAWRTGCRKAIVVACCCTVGFGLGIVLTGPAGNYILNLLDTYAGGWPVVIACLFEVIMVSWVYGYPRFVEDIKLMLGAPPNKYWAWLGYPVNYYWLATWVGITPALLTFVLLFTWVQYSPLTIGDQAYPAWADGLGWAVAFSAILWIPGHAIKLLIQAVRRKEYMWLVCPTDNWHAADPEAARRQTADAANEQLENVGSGQN